MTMAHDHDRRDCLAMFAKLSEYLDNELDELTCKDIEDPCRGVHSLQGLPGNPPADHRPVPVLGAGRKTGA